MTKIKTPAKLKPLLTPIADITPDPRNARRHSPRNVDAVRTSLQRFGWLVPLVAQRVGGALILRKGHATLEAARGLNATDAPVVVMPSRRKGEGEAFALVDNRAAELATWDDDVLREVLEDLDAEDLGVTGWEPEELDAILGRAPVLDLDALPPDPEPEADEAPPADKRVTVVLGPMAPEDWDALRPLIPATVPRREKSERC